MFTIIHIIICQNRTPADRSRFKNSSWDQNKTVKGNFYQSKIPESIPDWHFSISKSRDWKRIPGLQSLATIHVTSLSCNASHGANSHQHPTQHKNTISNMSHSESTNMQKRLIYKHWTRLRKIC